jgi:hypothetical protein
MAKENNQPCKCPIKCNRHGDCTACQDFHLKNNTKTYCEKSSYEKKFDREQAHIAKITSDPIVKIPNFTSDLSKAITPFKNLMENITNPIGLIGFKDNLLTITNATNKLYKAIYPNIQNFLGITSSIIKVFEEQMQDQYNFKQEIIEKWNNLETELKTKNRYFLKSDLLSILEKCIEEAKYILPKGKCLFRARKIDIGELSPDVESIIKKATDRFNDYNYQKLSDKEKDIWDYINNIPFDDWEQDYLKDLGIQNINFWGFNSKQSEAPPSSKTIPGRANPVGISYLYTAKSIITAISEIQPTIGQLISVGKIKTLKEFNFFNFNFYEAFNNSEFFEKSLVEINEIVGFSFEKMKVFFDTISELFSKPSLGYTENYYATQYISEFIKNKGFDGIIFNSSLKKGGKNYVLFDTSKDETDNPNNYIVVSSSLHKINNVSISEKRILPKRNNPNPKKYGEHNV